MAKLLITGGAGFIGSNFIHYWRKNYPNNQIINLDKLSYAGNLDNLPGSEAWDNYRFVQGDINDYPLLMDLLSGVDLIVHFAAETHVDRSIISSDEFVRSNVLGTRTLLEAAKNSGNIRFHHISTDEVFGSLSLDAPRFNEQTPYDPRSPYSASKAGADHLVRAYFHTHALPITISNCSNNYGPRQYPEKLIPLLITNLLEGKKIPIYGQGQNIRDWINVDDHNWGVDLIIKKGRIGETYCLGGDNEIDNLSIAKKILNILGYGEEMIDFVPDRLGHDLRYAIDFSKAKEELGFVPQVDFVQGLKDTVLWYKENEAWWKKLKKI